MKGAGRCDAPIMALPQHVFLHAAVMSSTRRLGLPCPSFQFGFPCRLLANELLSICRQGGGQRRRYPYTRSTYVDLSLAAVGRQIETEHDEKGSERPGVRFDVHPFKGHFLSPRGPAEALITSFQVCV